MQRRVRSFLLHIRIPRKSLGGSVPFQRHRRIAACSGLLHPGVEVRLRILREGRHSPKSNRDQRAHPHCFFAPTCEFVGPACEVTSISRLQSVCSAVRNAAVFVGPGTYLEITVGSSNIRNLAPRSVRTPVPHDDNSTGPFLFSKRSVNLYLNRLPSSLAGRSIFAIGNSNGVSRKETRSEEHTSELQSLRHLVCRLL